MGDKTNKIIKGMEIRTIIVAILGIAILILIANYTSKLIPSSSAFGPYPIDAVPVSPGIGDIPQPANLIFNNPVQITGLPSDPVGFEFDKNAERVSDIDGSNVVFYYADPTSNVRRIFVYNIKAKEIKEVEIPWFLSFLGEDGAPRIYENKIVFQDGGNIFLYDMSATPPDEIVFITDDVVQDSCSRVPNMQPDIYGSWVVWTHGVCSADFMVHNIFAKNIVTEEVRHLDPSPFSQISPRIFGNKIVWQDFRHRSIPLNSERYEKCRSDNGRQCTDVYMYDLITGEIKRLTPEYSAQSQPNIYKDNVVWFDDRNYEWTFFDPGNANKKDIYTYNIEMDDVTNVITLPREGYEYALDRDAPGIWNNLIVYGIDFGINSSLYPLLQEVYLYNTETSREHRPIREDVQWQTSRTDSIIGGFYPYFNIAWAQAGNGIGGSLNIFMLQGEVL